MLILSPTPTLHVFYGRSLNPTTRGRLGVNISLIWKKLIAALSSFLWGNTRYIFWPQIHTCEGAAHACICAAALAMNNTSRHRYHLSYPKLADEQASFLQAHVALLLDDLLDVLENIPSHRNIPAHVDMSSLLPQAVVHPLRQLLTQCVLHVFLTRRQRRNDKVTHETEGDGRFRRRLRGRGNEKKRSYLSILYILC